MRKKIVGLSTKTCKMKPGVFFIAKAQKHYSDANMDDATALDFLEKGHLKPDMFLKLPDKPKQTVKVEAEEAIAAVPVPPPAPTPEPAQVSKPKRKRKPSKK